MSDICPTCGHVKKEKKAPDPRVKEIIDNYYGKYVIQFGKTPPLVGGRDAMAIKRLLENWGSEDLKDSIYPYFASGKHFFYENGFDIPRFEKFMAEKGVSKNGTRLEVTGQRGESARDARNRQAKIDEQRLLSRGNGQHPRYPNLSESNFPERTGQNCIQAETSTKTTLETR